MTRPVRLVTPLGAALAVAVLLLSARDGGTSAATEAPEPSPPTTVPATTAPTPATAPVQDGQPGGATTPPGQWPKVGGQGCTTPWGDEEPSWCDPDVYTWLHPENGVFVCYVTPAGVAAHRVCPLPETTTTAGELPETAAGSRWA